MNSIQFERTAWLSPELISQSYMLEQTGKNRIQNEFFLRESDTTNSDTGRTRHRRGKCEPVILHDT